MFLLTVAGIVGVIGLAGTEEPGDADTAALQAAGYMDEPGGAASLEELRQLVDAELIRWLASLYEPETGGFYYSLSARNTDGFEPDIESTSQALGFLRTRVFEGELPGRMRENAVRFFQERQDAETGYFYDRQFGSDVAPSKRDRNLSGSVRELSALGTQPLYPLPTERALRASQGDTKGESSPLPRHYATEEAFLAYVKGLNWNRPYPSGNQLSSAKPTIVAMGYQDALLDYLDATQNAETGMWGTGRTYEELSGAMKLSSFYYTSAERPYPNAARMVESVVAIMTSERAPRTIVEIRNPFDLLKRATLGHPPAQSSDVDRLMREHLPALIRLSIENLSTFEQEDGGYSYYTDKSSPTSQGARVSLGVAEGDVNAATAGLVATITLVHEIVGASPPAYYQYEQLFLEHLSAGE